MAKKGKVDTANLKEARNLTDEITNNLNAMAGGYDAIDKAQGKIISAGGQMVDVSRKALEAGQMSNETFNRRVALVQSLANGEMGLAALQEKQAEIQDRINYYKSLGQHATADTYQEELDLVNMSIQRVGAIDMANSKQAEFNQMLKDATDEISSGVVGGLGEVGSMLDNFASKGLLAGGIITGIGLLTLYSGLLDDVGTKYGAIGSTQFSGPLIDANIEAEKLGMSAEDVQSSISGLASDFGVAFGEAAELSGAVMEMSKGLGIGGAEGAKLVGNLSVLSGLSNEAAINTSKQVAMLAAANGVAPVDVMNDVAESGEEFAKFGKDGGKNMLRAAIGAKKLGLNLKSVSGIMSGLLDFENSLIAEQEASLMLGRDVNLQKARELALNNDIEGAMREVVSQVGGEAEWNQMNALQRQALADSVGVGVDEMNKMVANQDKLDLAGNLDEQDAAAVNANATLSEQTKIMNEMKEIMRDLSKDLGPALGDVMRSFAEAAKTIVPVLSEIFKWIAAGLNALNNTVGLDNIMKALLGIWVISKMIALSTWMKTWTSSLKSVSGEMTKTSKGMNSLGKSAGAGGKGMSGFTKSLQPGKMVQGAAALLMISAALWISAKAFQEFATVEWSAMGTAAVALLMLTGVVALLGMLSGQIMLGAASILMVSSALMIAAVGFNLFSTVSWGAFGMGLLSLILLAGVAALLGFAAPFILIGAFAMLMLSLPLMLLAGALAIFSMVDMASVAANIGMLGDAVGNVSWGDMLTFALMAPLFMLLGVGLFFLGLGLQSLGKANPDGIASKMMQLSLAMDEMDPAKFAIFGAIGALIAMFGIGLIFLGKGLQSMGEVGELTFLAYNMEQLAIAMEKMDVGRFAILGVIGGLIANFGRGLQELGPGIAAFEGVDATGLADKFVEMNSAMSKIDVGDWFWVGLISPLIGRFGEALQKLAPGVGAMESVDVEGLSDKFVEMNKSFGQIDVSKWFWIGVISPQMITLSEALYPLADAMKHVNSVDMEGLAVKFMEMGYGLDALPVWKIYMLGESAPQLIELGNAMYEFADGMNYAAKTDMAGIGRNFMELGFAFKQIDLGHFLILGMLSPLFIEFGNAMIPFGKGMEYVANVDIEGVIYQFSALGLAMKQMDPKDFVKLVASADELGSFGKALIPLGQGVDAMKDIDANALVGQFARMSDAFGSLGARKMMMLQVAGIFMGSLSDMADTFPKIIKGVEAFSKVDLSLIGGQFTKFNDALDELPGGAKAWWAGMKMGFLNDFAENMYKLGSGVTAIMAADFNQLGPKFQELGQNLTAAETLKPHLDKMEGLDFAILVKLSDQLGKFVSNSTSFINMDPQSFANIGPNIKALVEGFAGIDPKSGQELVTVSQIAWGNIASMTKHFGKIGTNMAKFSEANMGDLGKNAVSFVEFAQTINEGGLDKMGNFSNLSKMAEAFTLISTALSEVSVNADTALPKLKELLGITNPEGGDGGGGNPIVAAINSLKTDMVLAKDELVTLNTKFEGAFGTAGTIPGRIGGKVGEAIEGGI